MKKSSLLTLTLCLWLCQCQKGVEGPTQQEKIKAAMLGKWRLLQMTDRFHNTYTNANPCFADNTFEITDGQAILSQGNCIEFPDKAQTIKFAWNVLAEDYVDLGGDTVKIIQSNNTSLVFKRDDPKFLEYHWYRNN